MKDDLVEITSQQFLTYAGTNLQRWQALMGLPLLHLVHGEGEVVDVLERQGKIILLLRFGDDPKGSAPRKFDAHIAVKISGRVFLPRGLAEITANRDKAKRAVRSTKKTKLVSKLKPGRKIHTLDQEQARQTGYSRRRKKKRLASRFRKSITMSQNRPVTHRKISHSGPAMQGGEIYRPRKVGAKPEPFECGWCYNQIWRVLQANGYYRYYDDKELTKKHRCTRPVHWRPDKG